jgi:hypothetical protein
VDWDSAQEGGPSPDQHLIFHVRLSGEEVGEIERAAVAMDMNVGEYLRHAALQLAERDASR